MYRVEGFLRLRHLEARFAACDGNLVALNEQRQAHDVRPRSCRCILPHYYNFLLCTYLTGRWLFDRCNNKPVACGASKLIAKFKLLVVVHGSPGAHWLIDRRALRCAPAVRP